MWRAGRYHEGMFSGLGYGVMAQLKDNMAVFREAVQSLGPDAKQSTMVFGLLEESN